MAKTAATKPINAFAARFISASEAVKHRIIWSSFGEVGSLKTTFGLGAPGPILVQDLDRGLEGVVEEFSQQKEIHTQFYESNTDALEQDGAIEIRDRFIADFEYAIENGIRTILWDKETQVYEIFKYAEFGAPSDKPANYYPLFQKYRKLFNLAKSSDINFGVIQGMRTPWGDKAKPNGVIAGAPLKGVRVRRGMAEVEELVHINLEHVQRDGEFFLQVGKSRGPGGRNIQNTELPYLDFRDFATLVFPDSDVSEWE